MIPYILNLFDLFTTLILLRMGGRELNPFLQDVGVMITAKVLIGWIVIRYLLYQDEPLARTGLVIAKAWFGALCVNNLFVIAMLVMMEV